MIVHDLHVGRVAICPHKAEAIPIIDTNAVLPFPVAFERFQVVAGERSQILQGLRFIECREFPLGSPFDDLIFPRELVVEEFLGFGVPKRANHVSSV